jgi:ankyrin repeat protein
MDDVTNGSLPPLYHACMANDLPLVKRLLEEGADPNDGESVYHSAQLNLRECLALLLAHGADISGRNATYGNTPLYFLAGHREGDDAAARAVLGMQWLLEHGADPNVKSEEPDETPLHCAARNGWGATLAELLLTHGADPDVARADGRTAFVLAVRTGNVAFAESLRAKGASTHGLCPVDRFLGACLRTDEAEARTLLSGNSDLMRDLTKEDRGAMVQAIYDRREASLRLMLSLGFDLSWEGVWGGTPLHHAAWLGNVTWVRLLLTKGAPVNATDSRFGSSPLGWAAHGSTHHREAGADHRAVVALLLDAGSHRTPSINRWGETPESMASPDVEELLRTRGFAP